MRPSKPAPHLAICAVAALSMGALCAEPETRLLAIESGATQVALVGTAVATPPSIKVTDAAGNPVEGVVVTFAVTSGGGTVTGATQSTLRTGIATVGGWTLGTVAGVNALAATAEGVAGGQVTFTAAGEPGPPTAIAIDAGENQGVILGSKVGVLPSAKVTDAFGNPVPNAVVVFAPATGGGSVTEATQLTSIAGTAKVGSWTPGSMGLNTLTATVTGVSTPATFIATAGVGPVSKLMMEREPGGAVSGVPLATQPAVRITDANGNTVTTATQSIIALIPGGTPTLSGTTTVQAVNGVATFTDLKITGSGTTKLSFTDVSAGSKVASVSSASITIGPPPSP